MVSLGAAFALYRYSTALPEQTVNSDNSIRRRLFSTDENGFFYIIIAKFAFINGIFQKFGTASCNLLGVGSCICNENSLRRFIESEQLTATICSDTTIELSDDVDISGRQFTLGCNFAFRLFDDVDYRSCRIKGGSNNRIFKGSPDAATFEKIEFSNGNADNGGLFSLTGGTVSFSECLFAEGQANGQGGAVFASGGSTVLNFGFDTIFDKNTAQNGGGVAVTDGASVEFRSSAFRGNSATADGGGLFVANSATASVQFSNLIRNKAGSNGGAISISNANANIGESSRFFQENEASSQGDNLYITGGNVECAANQFAPIIFCGAFGIDGGSTNCASVGQVESVSSDLCDPLRVDGV